ncbi:MAG: ArnT family glycosyltransferase [Acidobacteriota bacterium]
MRDPWLAASLLAAAALRLYGLGHGLPFVYNPDEANIMARALSVAQDPNPHYFLYPSLFFYLLFVVMGGLFLAGRLLGYYPSLKAFETSFFSDPTAFYMVGRVLGVGFALATILVTYHLACRHFGRTTARAAALFLAVAYFHVRDSHYLKHDVPVTLLIVLALVAFDRVMENRSFRSYVVTGIAMGIAFAMHYYTIFLAPAFVLCHAMVAKRQSWGRVLVAGLVSAVTFFLLSPFVVLDLPVALEHLKANRLVVVDRSLDAGALVFPSLPAYVRFLAEQGLGYVLVALMAAGWILMARRDKRRFVLWGGFTFFFIPFISYTFFAGRYLNPALPSLAVAAGLAVGVLRERFGPVLAAVAAVAASLQPLYGSLQVDRLFDGQDTRTLARQWILENVPDGESLALQSYSVPLPQSADSLKESLSANGALDELERLGKFSHLAAIAEQSKPSYHVFFMGRGDEKNRIYFDYRETAEKRLQPLRDRGVSYVALRYPAATPPPEVAAFIDAVIIEGRLLGRFSPFRGDGAGLRPYLDNEDWAASRALAHKGPLVELWSLDKDD